MDTQVLTFTAGQSQTVRGGNFLRILSSSDGIDLKFYKNNQPIEEAKDMGQGERFWPGVKPITDYDTRFDEVKITSATAQTVKIGISMGESTSDSVTGTVNVSSIATPLPQEPVLPRSLEGTPYFYSDYLTALQTVFTPAANTGGAIVSVYSGSVVTGGTLAIMVKESTPSDTGDVAAHHIRRIIYSAAIEQLHGKSEFWLPAGYGLYHQQSVANLAIITLGFDLL